MCLFNYSIVEAEATGLLANMLKNSERITSLEFKSALRAICNLKASGWGVSPVSITQEQVGAFLRNSFFLGKFPDHYRARIRRIYDEGGVQTAVYVEYYSEPCQKTEGVNQRSYELPRD